ncbi:hypothetical protein JK386_01490 [Nocardioides sp. zg-536]|uniref:Glycosyl transferase family 28 C-terminal domain-containing protein n=1 Tax=Nocardioides faecalis TaxID=2803858 RepID=A0A938Y260_9ACTN|nr:glycosyltransferase [Nocardioides faecalis]MBM9458568.1 hypothetical protein [Nocardioides faecalis]MBS4752899.1 hypothetical protein [Nocardioides faecalis]QVI58570.1 hypothetical protein KG111_16580 [Nocardioides faecalis]
MSVGPLVAVFLGTDHHRFDRLLGWARQLELQGTAHFLVQHGYTPLPGGLMGESMFDQRAMADVLDHAAAVVTHGGPGSIMDAREHGHLPVVVPRDPRWGEHVDGHQLDFARHLEHTGTVRTAYDLPTFCARLDEAVHAGRGPATGSTPTRTIDRFEALVEELVRR